MPARSARIFVCGIVFASALAAAACGGGGSSGGGGGSPAPPAGPPWSPGVFQTASTFENKCATVRTGADIQGTPFPDQPGSLLQEMHYLRSWTNKTYLWNTEVLDQNPANFTDRLAYFAALKTNALTASGRLKDNFHFSMATADWLAQSISAPTAGYGAELRIVQGAPPRDVRVLYTQAGTPAAELLAGTPKLARGARLLTVDGVDVINATSTAQVSILNAGSFPAAAGETHTFTVQYINGTTRTITMTSASIVETPVNRSTVLTTPTGNVGYVLFNTFSPFSSEAALVNTISAFKAQGVNDVVLDLRYNGGGLLAVASQLSYMVAGPSRSAGKLFETLRFNAAAGSVDPVTGEANTPTPFYSTGLGFSVAPGAPIPSLDLPRVYVLSTSSTCSASESVINGLRGIDVDVVLIGTKTCGKPFGFYPESNCGQTYFSIQFQGVNFKGFGDYPDGFAAANANAPTAVKIPGCSAGDDMAHELGDPSEFMLATALNHRAGVACPPAQPFNSAPASITGDGLAMESSGRSEGENFLRNSRDLTRPGHGAPR